MFAVWHTFAIVREASHIDFVHEKRHMDVLLETNYRNFPRFLTDRETSQVPTPPPTPQRPYDVSRVSSKYLLSHTFQIFALKF